MVKYAILVILLTFLNSCSNHKSIVGLYGKCGNEYLACTQILLKSEKTFEYFVFTDVGGGTVVKGKWEQISKDSIRLNTFDQPENSSTSYVGKINPNRTDIKIKISDFELPLAAAYIEINNNNDGKEADVNGMAEFKAQDIKTITYHFLGQKETVEIDNPDYNEIEITVTDLDFSGVPRFWTDKIMTIHKNEIFFNDGYSLKKTKLKNRQWK